MSHVVVVPSATVGLWPTNIRMKDAVPGSATFSMKRTEEICNSSCLERTLFTEGPIAGSSWLGGFLPQFAAREPRLVYAYR
jgi:hypothetical protein